MMGASHRFQTGFPEFTQGRRLGAGFGGWLVDRRNGPASMGPARCFLAPPNPSTAIEISIPSTPSWPIRSMDSLTRQPIAVIATDYTTQFDGWNSNGVVWSWADYLWQGGVDRLA
jgi:hypothetical protein